MSGLPDYLVYYHQLKEDKLADFENQFQSRLNQYLSESLLGFVQSIKDMHDDIKQKIESINAVLQKTEFKANSFLRLKTKKEKYPFNIEFDKFIKEIGNAHASNESTEKRYKLLQNVVSILEKATNPTTANNQESLRLLEPRYQLSFIAYTDQACIIPAGIAILSDSGTHQNATITMRWADKYNLPLATLGEIWQVNDKMGNADDAWHCAIGVY